MDIFTFEINGDYFGVPIENLSFIEGRWERIDGVVGIPDYIKEVVLINNVAVQIYDLAPLLGHYEQMSGREYMVLLKVQDMEFGLMLWGESEVISVDESETHPLPVEINAERNCLKSMVFHNGRMIGLIDVNKLIPSYSIA